MQTFKFTDAKDISTAPKDFTANRSQYLAGGTTLVDLMKLHVMTPSELIDLSELPLKKITDHNGLIEVGALVTNSEMAHSEHIKNNFPMVSEALLSGASVQLRNLATTAGNILQKTRCPYFRDPHSKCNKRRPGTGCDALNGFNRMHAILGVSEHCIAAHPSDLCVALMAAGAKIKTQRSNGPREISFEDFYTLPSNTPHVENILEPGELITSITLPKQSFFKRSTYVKIRDRSSYAFALTSAAVALELGPKNTVREIRIALGGVGTIPWRAVRAEGILAGQELTKEKIKEAAQSITSQAQPRTFNSFKIALAQQTFIRAVGELEKKS